MMAPVAHQKVFLIDTFGFIFRAYHARARSGAPPMRTSSGFSTEAVFIFNSMLRKVLKKFDPQYIAAVFESEEPTLRSLEFAEYKANRAETPPDLIAQIPQVRRLLDAMRIAVLDHPGFEADDVIGTVARRAEAAGCEVAIVSSDKDMLQLVTERVAMLNPAKDDEWYGPAEVVKFLGVRPDQVSDLLALKGDAVDNIPGAPGIGDKGAIDLLERFGTVEAAIQRAAEIERKTYRESLQNYAEQVRLRTRLATQRETEELLRQASEEIQKVLADIRMIRIMAQEELAAQRKFTDAAKLRSMSFAMQSSAEKSEPKKKRQLAAVK